MSSEKQKFEQQGLMDRANKRIRILCLHGWRTNKRVLSYQTQGLQSAFRTIKDTLKVTQPNHIFNSYSIEFIQLNAKFEAKGPPFDDVLKIFGDQTYFEWWDTVVKKEDEEIAENGSNLSDRKNESITYEGVEEAVEYINQFLEKHGPVDGILGFSQGAILTTILNSFMQQRLLSNEIPCFPWKISVLVSGMLPRDDKWAKKVEESKPLMNPSVHLLGEKDFLFTKSKEVISMYDPLNCETFIHSEGHKFPSAKEHQNLYRDIAYKMLHRFGFSLQEQDLMNEAN